MPTIKINNAYQIKSTPHTWEIQKLVRRNQHSVEWRFIANYNTVDNALRGLREMLIRLKGDLTYEKACKEVDQELSMALKEQNIVFKEVEFSLFDHNRL